MNTELKTRVGGAVRAAARAADRMPIAPKAIAGYAFQLDRLRARRMFLRSSPRWRELQAMTVPDGSVFADVWFEQHDLERQLRPQPRWHPVARALRRLSAEQGITVLSRTLQRSARGWSDQELWNLGQTLRLTLGAQLLALAEQTNQCPDPGDWGSTFVDWQSALRHRGAVLLDGRGLDRRTEPELSEARDRIRSSLRWVADHFDDFTW